MVPVLRENLKVIFNKYEDELFGHWSRKHNSWAAKKIAFKLLVHLFLDEFQTVLEIIRADLHGERLPWWWTLQGSETLAQGGKSTTQSKSEFTSNWHLSDIKSSICYKHNTVKSPLIILRIIVFHVLFIYFSPKLISNKIDCIIPLCIVLLN